MLKRLTNLLNMKLQIASDIHLEFIRNPNFSEIVKPVAENLALLGDIGYPRDENYDHFLKYCNQNFNKVFLITGNHEYYNCGSDIKRDMPYIDNSIKKIVHKYDNIHFLNNDSYDLTENVVILGTTLWSHIPNNKKSSVMRTMNDYNQIYIDNNRITPDKINKICEGNIKWLSEEIRKAKNNNKDVIVLTHHTPSYKSIAPEYMGFPNNCAFANNLDHLFDENENIKYWFFGHTHSSMEFKLGKAICASNPLGYKFGDSFENDLYSEKCVYELS